MIRDVASPSPILAIAFGGMAMRMGGTPPFELFRMLSGAGPAKRLFLRDRRRSWYHRGVLGVAEDIEGLVAELGAIAAEAKVSKVVMLGASSGGYAALLLGRLLGAEEVHAFAPQTFISPVLRAELGDRRWETQQSDLIASGRYQAAYGDLREVFRSTPSPGARFVVHYCARNELDATHAQWLASDPSVELRKYAEGGHNIAHYLRERGELQLLLGELLA